MLTSTSMEKTTKMNFLIKTRKKQNDEHKNQGSVNIELILSFFYFDQIPPT